MRANTGGFSSIRGAGGFVTAVLGDEEVIDRVLRAPLHQRCQLIRAACGTDEHRYRRLVRLAELADDLTTRRTGGVSSTPLDVGTEVGRYLIVEHLGSGGMGTVYCAYDRELDRRVALKLLDADAGDPRRSVAREAQLLARVDHPNVVTIFDVGIHEDQPFISMELVGGQTLRRWSATDHRWPRVLRVMIQAGRGLAAAHDAGVVHRDFKPENVMIDPSGRVVVTDFGIAWSSDAPGSDPLRGTAAYMAPEQRDGAAQDFRTDVYSYCAVVYEMLLGTPPPRDCDQPFRSPAPQWLMRAIRRGLETRPEDRWPTMASLLDALERRLRWRWVPTAAVVCVASLGAAAAGREIREAQALASCRAEGRALADSWNATTARELGEAFDATEVVYARQTWERTRPKLEHFAKTWETQRARVCVATRVDRVHNDEELTAARACFDAQRAQFSALTESLRGVSGSSVADAIDAAASLPMPQDCVDRPGDLDGLLSSHELSDAARSDLAAASAQLALGRPDQALHLVRASDSPVAAAGALAHCEAQMIEATAHERLGDYDEAERSLRRAYAESVVAGHERIALRAATELTRLAGGARDRPEVGLVWGDVARAIASRLGLKEGLALARLSDGIGSVHLSRGDYAAALAAHQRAHALGQSSVGAKHPAVVGFLNNVGVAHANLGDFNEALATQREVLAIKESALGVEHPYLAPFVANVGSVLFETGAYGDAREYFTRAIELEVAAFGRSSPHLANRYEYLALIEERSGRPRAARLAHQRALDLRRSTLGNDHPDVARSLHHIATLDHGMRMYGSALAGHRRALKILEAALGPEHPDVGGVLSGIGAAYSARGELEDALAAQTRAAAIVETAAGPTHPNFGIVLHNIGVLQGKLDKNRDALDSHSRALAILETALGAEHPNLVEILRAKGLAHARLGESPAAAAALERALSLAEGNRATGDRLARTQFALAQTIARGRPRGRSRRLAEDARRNYQDAGNEDAAADVARWLKRSRA